MCSEMLFYLTQKNVLRLPHPHTSPKKMKVPSLVLTPPHTSLAPSHPQSGTMQEHRPLPHLIFEKVPHLIP
jgi:hypothetical protein